MLLASETPKRKAVDLSLLQLGRFFGCLCEEKKPLRFGSRVRFGNNNNNDGVSLGDFR